MKECSDSYRLSGGWTAAALVMALMLGACGGGGSDADSPDTGASGCSNSADCGEVMVGITDADGDFVRYVVSIESMTLERTDGAIVNTMPDSATIDLAQFVDVTELLSTATVPQGTYRTAHLRIDYTNADVAVERDGGEVAAQVVDSNGDPLGVVDVDISFDALSRLVVRPGIPALLAIDFDLAASNTVDLTTTPVTVTAEPFLLADVNAADGKELHVAGGLQSADMADGTYRVQLRPFFRRAGDSGEATVTVTDETTYEVDGTPYTGADGLAAIADLADGAPTFANVTFDADDRALVATSVLAGSSVPGSDLDAIDGLVTSRDGDVLQVHGATLIRASGDVSFGADVEVTLASDLIVRQSGNPEADLDASAISVGQHITASGELNTDSSNAVTMQASHVRLLETHVSGDVQSVDPGALVVGLDAVDVRSPSMFDFTGTGIDAGSDADPSAYEIDSGSIDLAGIAAGTPVRVFGFVAPFGSAPPDFQARTVEDVTNAAWRMDLNWPDGSTEAFASLGSGSAEEDASIVLNLSDEALGHIHVLRRGGVFTDLLTLPASPLIVAGADVATPEGRAPRIYGIFQNGEVQLFLDFARFTEELANRMDGSVAVVRFHAMGSYDEGNNTFAAQRVAILLQ